ERTHGSRRDHEARCDQQPCRGAYRKDRWDCQSILFPGRTVLPACASRQSRAARRPLRLRVRDRCVSPPQNSPDIAIAALPAKRGPPTRRSADAETAMRSALARLLRLRAGFLVECAQLGHPLADARFQAAVGRLVEAALAERLG